MRTMTTLYFDGIYYLFKDFIPGLNIESFTDDVHSSVHGEKYGPPKSPPYNPSTDNGAPRSKNTDA